MQISKATSVLTDFGGTLINAEFDAAETAILLPLSASGANCYHYYQFITKPKHRSVTFAAKLWMATQKNRSNFEASQNANKRRASDCIAFPIFTTVLCVICI